MKAKTTRRALLMSGLSLVLCVSMLIGTTFAWFTDTVVSDKNIIQSGNLDVVLEYWDGSKYTEVTSQTKLFDDAAKWEPGHTEVAYLKVRNAGSLALKYQLNVNVHGETIGYTKDNTEIRLSDYLVFGVTDKQITSAADVYTRETAIAAAGTTRGLKSYNGKTMPLDVKNAEGTSNYEDYVALIIYMPETVGNEANHNGKDVPSIEMGVSLYATQLNSESDSFGSDYDENAWHESMKVYSAQDLQSAIDAGETNITVMDDIDLSETIIIPAPAVTTYSLRAASNAIVIDLNGKTIKANCTAIKNNGNLVLKNGTIDITSATATTLQAVDNHGTLTIESGTYKGAKTLYSYAIRSAGNLTINDAVVEGGFGGVAIQKGSSATINGGTFSNSMDEGAHVVIAWANTNLVINGGNFVGHKQANGNYQYVVIGTGDNNSVVINGGNFVAQTQANNNKLMFSGNVSVKGGTFDVDPSRFVASGLKAVASNGKYVIVSETIADDNVVGTTEELEDALTGAADAGSGDNTIVMTDDIDLTGTTWTPIKVDGYNGAGVITIEGNGNTIKGLTAPLFAGGFAGKSGIIIKDLTIADSDIVSTSGLGGGAFIDSADSMQVITLENCHLVNSTVKGERTGGLIGWCSGYAKLNDGPVKTYVTISNCSVVDSTVTGAGSAGAIAGHPGASDYTYTTIENCVVKNVDVVSNDNGSWRTGAIVGTANNGHIVINNVSVEEVTLTQNGVAAENVVLFGRFVPAGTGTLVIDGSAVVNDADQLKEAIDNGENDIFLAAGEYTLPTSLDGVSLIADGDATINVGNKSQTITLGDNVELKGITFSNNRTNDTGVVKATGENIVIEGCTFELVGNSIGVGIGVDGTSVTIKDCTFTGGYKGIGHASGNDYSLTVDNCTFTDSDCVYGIHVNAVKGDIIIKNSKIGLFNTFFGYEDESKNTGSLRFENCEFVCVEGKTNVVKLYRDAEFVNCTFEDGFLFSNNYANQDADWTFIGGSYGNGTIKDHFLSDSFSCDVTAIFDGEAWDWSKTTEQWTKQ